MGLLSTALDSVWLIDFKGKWPKIPLGCGVFAVLNKYLLSLVKFFNSSRMYPHTVYSQVSGSCQQKTDKTKELVLNIYLYMPGKA